MNSIPVMAKIGLALKAEFFDLVALKEAHDDVDSLPSPTGDLVVQPSAREPSIGWRPPSFSREARPAALAWPGRVAKVIADSPGLERVQVSLGSKPWHWVVGQFEFRQWVESAIRSPITRL